MSFNNGLERKRFDARMKKQRKEYAAAGMSEEAIQAMYEFDLKVFKSDRRYYEHTQPLLVPGFDFDESDDEKNPLFQKFISVLSVQNENSSCSRYWWVEELDNTLLVTKLKSLNLQDLELLTLYAIDRYTQAEIAEIQGVSKQNIHLKLKRIKKLFAHA